MYLSKKFEVHGPGRYGTEMQERANDAASYVSQYGGSGKDMSVKIDKVEINTQATDGKQVASDFTTSLGQEIRMIYGAYDDGQAK
jgi:hypothetical protein